MPVKICKSLVRSGYDKVPCMTKHNSTTAEPDCPNRDMHVWKTKSGYCGMGQCEGTKPKSSSGVAMPTCSEYLLCGCKCHQDIWDMAKMAGTPRVLMDRSEYTPPPRQYWLPSDEPYVTTRSSTADVAARRTIIESPAPDRVPTILGREFTTTATGRASRGALEAGVLKQTNIWLIEEYPFPCTPAWLADEIASDEGIKTPSVGAIGAIFDRWTKLGFAVCERGPVRFVKYTPDGIQYGLEGLKEKRKREAKFSSAETRRTSLA